MPGVIIREKETFETAMRRFKKQTEKSGVLSEVRRRRYFEKPSIRLKKKTVAARKRAMRRQVRGRQRSF